MCIRDRYIINVQNKSKKTIELVEYYEKLKNLELQYKEDKINQDKDLTKELLKIPNNYYVGIVPASDTGAIEMLLWSLLGERSVAVLAWESFGLDWVKDITEQLKINNSNTYKAPYGDLVNLNKQMF